jgi:hypothetical protein
MIGIQAHKITSKDFDPKSQYSSIISAVKDAGNGAVEFFEVKHGSTRVEYLIISVDTKAERLVGLKTLSVQS